jgi:hypothetical protein
VIAGMNILFTPGQIVLRQFDESRRAPRHRIPLVAQRLDHVY